MYSSASPKVVVGRAVAECQRLIRNQLSVGTRFSSNFSPEPKGLIQRIWRVTFAWMLVVMEDRHAIQMLPSRCGRANRGGMMQSRPNVNRRDKDPVGTIDVGYGISYLLRERERERVREREGNTIGVCAGCRM